jgi:SAM-dependent methyltransferase
VGGDVIEHVGDQRATLREAHRVLVPGGRLFLASPNRYSTAPEPHVQVWGVGFLPRRWMPAYVRLIRGVEFKAIRTLGVHEWQRLLRASPFGAGRIMCPALPECDLREFRPIKRVLARAYNRIVSSRLGQTLMRCVGPLFHVECTRTIERVPPASPATRRRSTRTRARS